MFNEIIKNTVKTGVILFSACFIAGALKLADEENRVKDVLLSDYLTDEEKIKKIKKIVEY